MICGTFLVLQVSVNPDLNVDVMCDVSLCFLSICSVCHIQYSGILNPLFFIQDFLNENVLDVFALCPAKSLMLLLFIVIY